ncbi:Low-density lipoprotein receptor-related protein 8 [Frankliniella fusca]|uniref:Low-density lipoprotein receptor-related protein 8 n=1 Tax=Frankliniella fusca TaxID=407009 RepID=A0AAE1HHZ5_9NEOP|nr:Low-density lipoprotein receptor-related protein 8 [Frankliniella fusca]
MSQCFPLAAACSAVSALALHRMSSSSGLSWRSEALALGPPAPAPPRDRLRLRRDMMEWMPSEMRRAPLVGLRGSDGSRASCASWASSQGCRQQGEEKTFGDELCSRGRACCIENVPRPDIRAPTLMRRAVTRNLSSMSTILALPSTHARYRTFWPVRSCMLMSKGISYSHSLLGSRYEPSTLAGYGCRSSRSITDRWPFMAAAWTGSHSSTVNWRTSSGKRCGTGGQRQGEQQRVGAARRHVDDELRLGPELGEQGAHQGEVARQHRLAHLGVRTTTHRLLGICNRQLREREGDTHLQDYTRPPDIYVTGLQGHAEPITDRAAARGEAVAGSEYMIDY